MNIRAMTADDWDAVSRIYAEGIATGNATFETQTPTWEAWDAAHHTHSRLVVCADDGTLFGWAALSPISKRRAYAGVAEHSIYIAESARGRGIGRALLTALIETAESEGIWTIQSSIFPENAGSVALHARCGFRQVGYREKIAQLNGVWRNTILIERRSTRIGV